MIEPATSQPVTTKNLFPHSDQHVATSYQKQQKTADNNQFCSQTVDVTFITFGSHSELQTVDIQWVIGKLTLPNVVHYLIYLRDAPPAQQDAYVSGPV